MTEEWRQRLLTAIEQSGRSDRSLALASGMGKGFVSQMRNDNKAPGIPNFLKLCETLNVSPVYILTGIEVSRDSEELLRIYSALPVEDRQSLRSLIARLSNGVPQL